MVKYLVFCVFVTAGYLVFANFPVNHGPGVVAENGPEIKNLSWQSSFSYKDVEVTPVRTIDGEVRIIKRKRYFFDELAKYSPVDAVVGWDELSDEVNLKYVFYDLDNRKLDMQLTRPPIPISTIYQKSDLWHLIPANSSVDKILKTLRNGHVVKVKGLLVDIEVNNKVNYTTAKKITMSENTDGYFVWIEEIELI